MADESQLEQIGSTGLTTIAGRPAEEFLPQLRGRRGARVFNEMRENDPIIGAAFFAIESLIRKAEWRVDPADASPKAEEVALFVRECMNDMDQPWVEFVAEALSMLVYGWSYHEIVYKVRGGWQPVGSRASKYSDGRLGWRKLAPRSQTTLWEWKWDEEDELLGMVQLDPYAQRNPGRAKFIPLEKAMLFRTTSRKANPEGRSTLRSAYRPWYFKKNIEEFEAIGIERELAGLPVAWVPPKLLSDSASPEDRAVLNAFKDIVRRVKANEMTGLVLPLSYDEKGNKRFDFQLLSSQGRRAIDTNTTIERYDKRIAMTFLADFIMLGHEQVGSFALASSKTHLFSSALGAYLGIIGGQFNEKAIPDLLRVNGIDLSLQPTLVLEDLENTSVEDVVRVMEVMTKAGAPLFPDGELENWLRSLVNAPARPEVDETLPTPPPLPPMEDDSE